MTRSTDRILTTHVGSLPRPLDLIELYKNKASDDVLAPALKSAVAEVVRKQLEVGIDIVNDGEFGKPTDDEYYNPWGFYTLDRLTGFEVKDTPVGDALNMSKDRTDFAEFYATAPEVLLSEERDVPLATNVGPITYTGHDIIGRDVDDLKAAVAGTAAPAAFVTALNPAPFAPPGKFYGSPEEEARALADAMREEYKAITDAGFLVQLDDPHLVNTYEFVYSKTGDMKAFLAWADQHIELVNYALQGLPEDQVRYHVCWGSWKGPHASDLPLADVVDLMLQINASQYSIEAANPQHEHEWKVWKDTKLPAGKVLIPGVVTHKTNVIEHPEVVADRIINFAEVVGPENIIASTDCGMGQRIHSSIAWAKLKALGDGAALASKRLLG